MKHVKFSKKLEWLKPYVFCVKDMVNLDKLKIITTFTVPLNKSKNSEACLIRYDSKNYKMTITLYDHIRVRQPNGKYKLEYTKHGINYILDSLAHELAHLKYFDHRPEHLGLQAKMLVRMSRQAKKLGVTDLTVSWKDKK